MAATYLTYRGNQPIDRGSSVTSGFHNRAAFVAYQRLAKTWGRSDASDFRNDYWRGADGGRAYIADAMASPEAKPIVNWSVVAENIDTVTALARAGWKRIAG